MKVAWRAWYLAHVHQRKGGVWWGWSRQQQPQVHWLHSWVPTASCHLPGGWILPLQLVFSETSSQTRPGMSPQWVEISSRWQSSIVERLFYLKHFHYFWNFHPRTQQNMIISTPPFSSSRFPYKLPSFMPFNLFLVSLDNFQVQLVQLISAWTWAIRGSRGRYHWSYSQ